MNRTTRREDIVLGCETTFMDSPLAHALAGTLCLSVFGCGSLDTVPIRMLAPAPLSGDTAWVEDVQIELRVAYDGLQIFLRNAGPDAVLVNWGKATLATPDGRIHPLASPGMIDRMRAIDADIPRPPSHHSWLTRETPVSHFARHERPASYDQLPLRSIVAVDPGRVLSEILYPAEHLVLRADGLLETASLLYCHGSVASQQGAIPIELHVPMRIRDRWRVVRLAAEVPGATEVR